MPITMENMRIRMREIAAEADRGDDIMYLRWFCELTDEEIAQALQTPDPRATGQEIFKSRPQE